MKHAAINDAGGEVELKEGEEGEEEEEEEEEKEVRRGEE